MPDDPTATNEDRAFITRANELAQAAVKHGNHPFGALLVKDGKIIFEYENTIYTTKDATKHAECGLISAATPKFESATIQAQNLVSCAAVQSDGLVCARSFTVLARFSSLE
jgi:tRNA(Arg) A34 adenosine deaminase TadA